ncbi:hypothetical protein Bhyg_02632 [Pseudolycoriella hygida]|uniref:Jacalin-type lectin domain-containing protein n=1 Tax=Pseudolycoriella hygida TaxID=35572 RepID=A0A9Q0S8R0_9DIPT|nr:hypothetical protein Bhyg_02632 [Pseudolycoriella hygida]
MFAPVLLILILFGRFSCSTQYNESRRHGGDGGSEFNVVCPYDGAITGINYRFTSILHQIEFICTSSMGKSTIGPFGGDDGRSGKIECPQGQYISSFYGRSAIRVDRIGIRCKSQNDIISEGTPHSETGGSGGDIFDDLDLSIGARPVSILVRAGKDVDAIQITYANITVPTLCVNCCQYEEEWAPKHGGGGGTMSSFICPEQGVLTGITFKSGKGVDSLQFTCTSSLGESTFGPYGGSGGTKFEEKCPRNSYIASIHGRSGSLVDKLGIRCVKVGQADSTLKRNGHGGDGGIPFDDESFTTRGRRPVEIKIWSGSQVDAIQIKYGNMPMALRCKVAKIETIDQILVANDCTKLIGIISASTCPPIEQKLQLQSTQSVSESLDVVSSEGDEFNWQTTVSVNFLNIGASLEVSVTQSIGGSKSWSDANTKSETTEKSKLEADEITYNSQGVGVGGGASFGEGISVGGGVGAAFRLIPRHKIGNEYVPVLYNFQCDEDNFECIGTPN